MKPYLKKIILLAYISILYLSSTAQTDIDAIMMNKHQLCIGPMFGGSSFKNYWEGTDKRDNANLGTVSSRWYSIEGSYGITNKLNFLFGVPYIINKTSAGQMQKMKGLQDVSLWLKYMPMEKQVGNGVFSAYTIVGISFPASNYVADYLPVSIGMHSTNLNLRGMIDYQVNSFFATISGTYTCRSNVTIDRTSYYTTEIHYTNQVNLPDVTQLNVRTGLRNERFIAEAVFNKTTSRDGFDITKNNMPFLSNKIDRTTIGFNGKYNLPPLPNLSVTAGVHQTIQGRNIGQATQYNAGIFYIIGFKKPKPAEAEISK